MLVVDKLIDGVRVITRKGLSRIVRPDGTGWYEELCACGSWHAWTQPTKQELAKAVPLQLEHMREWWDDDTRDELLRICPPELLEVVQTWR